MVGELVSEFVCLFAFIIVVVGGGGGGWLVGWLFTTYQSCVRQCNASVRVRVRVGLVPVPFPCKRLGLGSGSVHPMHAPKA